MSVKTKILIPVVLLTLALGAKFILWDFAVSTGKRTGNLVKLSKKGKLLKTWEGTMDLGSGDKLTFDFSVKNDEVAKQMYDHTGDEISIFYEEHMVGWPRETKYDVASWSPIGGGKSTPAVAGSGSPEKTPSAALDLLNKTLFCSTVGSLYADQDLYNKVKKHLKANNLYLYRQIEKCND